MTSNPSNESNENSDGPDVNDVLHHHDESQADPDQADDDVAHGLSEG